MRLATLTAQDSPDLNEKVGAVIRTEKGGIFVGCNDFPWGVRITAERLAKPQKFAFTEHAERVVIFKAAKYGVPLDGAILFTTKSPCPDCARAIVMSGIVQVHTYKERDDSTWKADSDVGLQILAEAEVDVVFHS